MIDRILNVTGIKFSSDNQQNDPVVDSKLNWALDMIDLFYLRLTSQRKHDLEEFRNEIK